MLLPTVWQRNNLLNRKIHISRFIRLNRLSAFRAKVPPFAHIPTACALHAVFFFYPLISSHRYSSLFKCVSLAPLSALCLRSIGKPYKRRYNAAYRKYDAHDGHAEPKQYHYPFPFQHLPTSALSSSIGISSALDSALTSPIFHASDVPPIIER